MNTRSRFASVLLVVGATPTLYAGDIVVRRNGEAVANAPTFTAGTAITIACPTPVDGIAELWIYDTTRDSITLPGGGTGTVPNQGCGKITITGAQANTELRILIAGPNSIWPERSDDDDALSSPGVTDLGTLTSSGIVIEDETLRAHTRLAGYTTDDIRGDITVGQVQRVVAGYRPPGGIPNPGTVHANITAVSIDVQFGGGSDRAIGYVRASNGIVGNLIAVGDPARFDGIGRYFYASIGRIVVGPSEQALGIQGDIKAERGRIGSIYTTGPIGAEAVGSVAAKQPNIWAGDGIAEILAVDETSVSVGFPAYRAARAVCVVSSLPCPRASSSTRSPRPMAPRPRWWRA